MTPQGWSHSYLWICKYVILHGERDFSDVVKFRILKWIGYPGFFGWAKYNHKGLYKDGVVELERVEGVRTEARGWSDARKGS